MLKTCPHDAQFFRTENRSSIRFTLPCRSFTVTVSVADVTGASGVLSCHSQRLPASGVNFPERFSPATTPSIATSLVTVNVAGSRPDQAFAHGDGGGVVDLEDLDRGAGVGRAWGGRGASYRRAMRLSM